MKITGSPAAAETTLPGAPSDNAAQPSSTAPGAKRAAPPDARLADLPTAKRPRLAPDTARARAASLPAAGGEGRSPALSSLLGHDRAAQLDRAFGSLQPVRTKDKDGIHAWEREADGRVRTHPARLALPDAKGEFPAMDSAAVRAAIDLEALKSGEKRYIWAVSALGRLFVGEELPAGKDPQSGKQRHAGHPLLVSGGPARISGEFQYAAERNALVMLDKSGRYSRYEDRNAEQLDNAAAILKAAFASSGMNIETQKVTGKAPEPLILPTLANR